MTTTAIPGARQFIGIVAAAALTIAAFGYTRPSSATQPVPEPAIDAPLARAGGLQTAVFAGGCFWGVEAVFEHVRGVTDVASGYSGGDAASANYPDVSAGRTRHAEAVRITFDPAVISYGQLLKVFFSVAHDPTQLNRQGPDRGPQYRSAIFFGDAGQKRIADLYMRQMTRAGTYGAKPIVTQLQPLHRFYRAEPYHQDFARLNPTHPYIVHWDAPKLRDLQRRHPALYRPGGLAATKATKAANG